MAKSADTEFDTIGETGGAKTVTLTGAQSGLPAHSHPVDYSNTAVSGASQSRIIGAGEGVATVSTRSNSAASASEAHTNLQPYIVVYRYRRTA